MFGMDPIELLFTLAYGAISGTTGKSSVYQVPADGSGKPVLVATEASSPVPMP